MSAPILMNLQLAELNFWQYTGLGMAKDGRR
jgi:hypothetical protein